MLSLAAHGRRTASVVIPCNDAEVTIVPTLASIERSSLVPHEVICVDDGSQDHTMATIAAYARQGGLGVRCVSQPRRGAASARNIGWRTARGDDIVFLDADVVLAPDTLAVLVERLRQGGCAAVVAMYSDLSLRSGSLAQFQSCLARCVFESIDPCDSPYLGTQCVVVKRSTLADLRGFDDAYPSASVEDFELGVRLRQQGHRICIAREATIFHNHGYTFPSFVRNYYLKARDLSVLRHRSPRRSLPMRGYAAPANALALAVLLAAATTVPVAMRFGLAYLSLALAAPVALVAIWHDFLRRALARHGAAYAAAFVGLRALVTVVGAAGVLRALLRSHDPSHAVALATGGEE